LLGGKTFFKGMRMFEWRRMESELEEHGGRSGREGTSPTIYCRKVHFLPAGSIDGKKDLAQSMTF
jgi:hypothetical protein